jgi:hypothetical protein
MRKPGYLLNMFDSILIFHSGFETCTPMEYRYFPNVFFTILQILLVLM